MKEKRIGIFRTLKTTFNPDNVEGQQDIVEDNATIVERYLQSYLRKLYDIDVKGFTMPYDGSYGYNKYAFPPYFHFKEDTIQFYRDGGTEGFLPTNWHITGGSSGWCGLAFLGHSWSVRYNTWTCGAKTDIHELFHADPDWKLGHSGVVNLETGEETEYGGNYSMMGEITFSLRGLNAPHLYQLGVAEGHIVEADETFNLAPVEMPAVCLNDNEYSCVILRVPGHPDYCLSIRKVRGHMFALPAQRYEKTLFIHRMDRGRKSKRCMPDTIIGRPTVLPNGVTVNYLSYNNESAEIQVQFGEAS